jgi:hypothetical protein
MTQVSTVFTESVSVHASNLPRPAAVTRNFRPQEMEDAFYEQMNTLENAA